MVMKLVKNGATKTKEAAVGDATRMSQKFCNILVICKAQLGNSVKHDLAAFPVLMMVINQTRQCVWLGLSVC